MDDLSALEDDALWEYVTRGVTPLPGRKVQPISPARSSTLPIQRQSEPSFPTLITNARSDSLLPLFHGYSAGVDGNTARRMRNGKLPVEATLDLHGQTREEAFEALRHFLQNACGMGKRCVRIITGKGGRREGLSEGVLRSHVPVWLNLPEFRPYVLMFDYAPSQDGGMGALYVLLRKKPYTR